MTWKAIISLQLKSNAVAAPRDTHRGCVHIDCVSTSAVTCHTMQHGVAVDCGAWLVSADQKDKPSLIALYKSSAVPNPCKL